MTDRAKFIANVTNSLGRIDVLVPTAPDASTGTAGFDNPDAIKANADRALADAEKRASELTGLMAYSAASAGWNVHRAANPEDAAGLIANICERKNAQSVLRSTHDVLSQIGVDVAVTSTGATIGITEHSGENSSAKVDQSKATAFSADIGITGVDYAIAETGTVVLHPRSGLSRLVSLAPATHIAVLKSGDVLDSLDELFALERNDFLNGELAGSLNLISGPSKTADIEGTTVTGIHGPLEVHLIILE